MDILNEVFARQYAQLRYGETNNVIKFFEREVARLYRILTNAEDDLIRYNVEKRIINYGEQTRVLANMDGDQQKSDNSLLKNQATTRALMDYLERQLGDRAKIIKANKEFTDQVTDISRIQSRISNLRLMSSEGGGSGVESQLELAKAEDMLQKATENVKGLIKDIEAGTYSTETGVKANDMIARWLEQVLLLERTKAEIGAQDINQFHRRQLHGNVEGSECSPSPPKEPSDDYCHTSCTEPSIVPYERPTYQSYDDFVGSLPFDLPTDGHVLLHHRVARSHTPRPYAF